jgi:hypothetical protein
MTNQAFESGFTKLVKIFPNMNFDVRLFWEMLSDLDAQYFGVSAYVRKPLSACNRRRIYAA